MDDEAATSSVPDAPQNMVLTVSQGNSTAVKILGNASSLPILEGQSLRLVCVADSNPPAQLSWFRESPTPNASLISSTGYMELPQAGTGEEGVFTCQAENQLGSQHVLLNVSVHCESEYACGVEGDTWCGEEGLWKADSLRQGPEMLPLLLLPLLWGGAQISSLSSLTLTQSLSIQIPGILEFDCPRNLTCTLSWAGEQGTLPNFSWNSAALTSVVPRTHLSSVLTLSRRPQNYGTSLTCQVTFPAVGVTEKRTIQFNISYVSQNMAITVFQGNSTGFNILGNASSLPILQGQSLHLVCVADSNPPAELTLFRQSQTLNASLFSNPGYVELPETGAAERMFTCRAQNQLASQHVLFFKKKIIFIVL
ncbi:sialic acid-binding Ig-like lectin 6 [Loxodonta africana]|uniref:sialic acid-binding Ig-like lectin 6 n=1 Tax=Loxodonta africana TaxID=9785 RepID=UPI0030CF0E93